MRAVAYALLAGVLAFLVVVVIGIWYWMKVYEAGFGR